MVDGKTVGIVFLVIIVLTLIGVTIWLALKPSEVKPQTVEKPETEEEKKARLEKEAAALTAATAAKEQAFLDSDVKDSADKLANVPTEVKKAVELFRTLFDANSDPVKFPPDKLKEVKLSFQIQRERALNSAGLASHLANNIENRAKALKKDSDAAVVKAITDLRTSSNKAFTALSSIGTAFIKDANGCMKHPTGNGIDVICPERFSTFYTDGVTDPADCRTPDGVCNRCIGFEFPKPAAGSSSEQWNSNQWASPTGQSSGPVKEGEGKIMSFNGIYVVDAVPVDSQKCS